MRVDRSEATPAAHARPDLDAELTFQSLFRAVDRYVFGAGVGFALSFISIWVLMAFAIVSTWWTLVAAWLVMLGIALVVGTGLSILYVRTDKSTLSESGGRARDKDLCSRAMLARSARRRWIYSMTVAACAIVLIPLSLAQHWTAFRWFVLAPLLFAHAGGILLRRLGASRDPEIRCERCGYPVSITPEVAERCPECGLQLTRLGVLRRGVPTIAAESVVAGLAYILLGTATLLAPIEAL
ncbi:MAG: hypothetical protein RBS39_02075 [Phycisphaerales bacterium]|jgi:hypothetical protein|nr:hypothetical protein [Phycisphaerales bacterium]